jgi:hypothetical protein
MDYNKLAARVLKSLRKYGQNVTLRQYSVGGGEYDSNTQTASIRGGPSTDSVRKGLVTDQPGTRIGPQYGTNLKPNTLIQDGEKWVYVDAIGVAPKIQDHMIVNGVEYNIADVQVTAPGGIAVFYLLVLRL